MVDRAIRLYAHHVVFAIDPHAFVFLLVAVVTLPEILGLDAASSWMAPLLLGVPVYVVLAMKRFYGESWLGTVTLLGLLTFSILNA